MMIQSALKMTNATRKSVHQNTGGMHSMIFGGNFLIVEELIGIIHLYIFSAQEWISKKQPVRTVGVIFDSISKQIKITCQQGNLLRAVDLGFANVFKIYSVTDMPYLIINSRHSYDLVCSFIIKKNFLTILSISKKYNF